MQGQFKYLFTPFKVGPITIKNRICSTAHVTNFSKDNILDERYIEYQKARAKGGVGLIITGAMAVMPNLTSAPLQIESCNFNELKVVPSLHRLCGISTMSFWA